VRPVLFFALSLTLAACAPPACSESGERAARKYVKTIVDDDGPLAEAARDRLVARGASAIPVSETGLYSANPPARLRLVRTLDEIHSHEALPIFEHLVAHDPNPDVKDAARRAISSLSATGAKR
jgi:hypothetical protein